MLWCGPFIRFKSRDLTPRQGMEAFFDANRSSIMRWITNASRIPHIHDICRELVIFQAKHPEFGPLWRVKASFPDGDPQFFEAAEQFTRLMRGDITPAQHSTLIHLLCQDIEQGPPDIFANYFTDDRVWRFEKINNMDPCVCLLVKSIAGPAVESLHLPPVVITDSRRDSYTRVATHLMRQHEGTTTPFILRMQACLWNVFPGQDLYYERAPQEPQVFVSHPLYGFIV